MAWVGGGGNNMAVFKTRNRVQEVHIDGLAMLKLVKHCTDSLPQMVAGSLLGLDQGSILEITHCFPFPAPRAEPEEFEQQPVAGDGGASASGQTDIDGEEYQMEMMKMLREVNVDNNCVGWYKSIYASSFCQTPLIETQFSYQENLSDNCVVLLYDPVQAVKGTSVTIKAYQLSEQFIEAFRSKSNGFIAPSDILVELPLKIRNAGLITAFLYDAHESGALLDGREASGEALALAPSAPLERYLENMAQWIDDLVEEQAKFQYYLRNVERQKDQQRWAQKRKEDGDANAEDNWKNAVPPTRLDSLLITNQINEYCSQIQRHTSCSLSKLYLSGCLQKPIC